MTKDKYLTKCISCSAGFYKAPYWNESLISERLLVQELRVEKLMEVGITFNVDGEFGGICHSCAEILVNEGREDTKKMLREWIIRNGGKVKDD